MELWARPEYQFNIGVRTTDQLIRKSFDKTDNHNTTMDCLFKENDLIHGNIIINCEMKNKSGIVINDGLPCFTFIKKTWRKTSVNVKYNRDRREHVQEEKKHQHGGRKNNNDFPLSNLGI